ncbi:MAG: hypothetical protein ACKVQJ_03660 [Pyrinomonadaceae bacterium]
MRNNAYILILILINLFLSSCGSQDSNNSASTPETQLPVRQPIQEGLPTDMLEMLEKKAEQLEAVNGKTGTTEPSTIISASRTWQPGRKLTVAFNGGTPELRQKIVETVKAWADAANISFDFGGGGTGNYREWTVTDSTYKADIRIAFDRNPEGGYWSAIGKDSINPLTRRPNIASMNFEGFIGNLPDDWQATVLHEFGHALGFQHEHQSTISSCEQEYRWDDEPGYVPTVDQYHQFVPDNSGRRPGIYTTLGGAPNYWSKAKIDFNLKKFATSSDWFLTAFDRRSIMRYYFGPEMYKDLSVSSQSGCYGPRAVGLSADDQGAAATLYPRDKASIKTVVQQQQVLVQKLLKLKDLPSEIKEQLKTTLKIK